MCLHETHVHNHAQPGVTRAFRCSFINHTFLHPNHLGANLNCLLNMRHYEFTFAKNVHDINCLTYWQCLFCRNQVAKTI